MKELWKKAFPKSEHRRAEKQNYSQKGFFDSLAEGYELNLLDEVTSGETM